MTGFDYLISAKRTVAMERDALSQLEGRIDENFTRACDLIMASKGRVIISGIGKSGHIGKKIAATLASTGTPAFFVHPSEASHGDFGMITKNDVVVAISNSGSSNEIITLLPLIKRMGITLIAMTGKLNSPLAESANATLDVSVETEACPLNLAPTSSTTVTLAMGDALAVALLEARGFSAEDFAFSHPGGALGRKLLLRVHDLMHQGDEIPRVNSGTPLKEALKEMTSKGLGMTVVIGEDGHLAGIFTDGDLRRCIDKNLDINAVSTNDVMTINPRTVSANMLAAEALGIMQDKKITALVVEDDNEAKGVIHMHDLLRAGII